MKPADDQRASPIRSAIATLLIVLFSTTSAGRALYERENRRDNVPHDRERIAEFGRRLASLESQLPARGEIGFLSDTGGTSREYILSQYFLAPLIVQYGPYWDVVVGHYSDDAEAALFVEGRSGWAFPKGGLRLRMPPPGFDGPTASQE